MKNKDKDFEDKMIAMLHERFPWSARSLTKNQAEYIEESFDRDELPDLKIVNSLVSTESSMFQRISEFFQTLLLSAQHRYAAANASLSGGESKASGEKGLDLLKPFGKLSVVHQIEVAGSSVGSVLRLLAKGGRVIAELICDGGEDKMPIPSDLPIGKYRVGLFEASGKRWFWDLQIVDEKVEASNISIETLKEDIEKLLFENEFQAISEFITNADAAGLLKISALFFEDPDTQTPDKELLVEGFWRWVSFAKSIKA